MVHGEIGVLLMAHGSPGRLDDIEAYYTHIRGGRSPSPEEVARLKERYRRIGGRSPLSQIAHAQAQALEKNLNREGRRFRVYVGMRHWRPFIHQTANQMVSDGIQEAVGLALTPHYSRLSVGAYIEAARKALEKLHSPMQIRFVESWHDHPLFLGALAERVRQGLARFPQEERGTVIFTAHSLPERILEWGDPYPRHLRETCAAVAQQLSLSRWRFAYQGARRADEPWLGPDVLEVLDALAQQDRPAALICPVGFVADHLEVLYDIDVECRERAAQLGLHLERTISFNDDPRFIRALAAIVEENLP